MLHTREDFRISLNENVLFCLSCISLPHSFSCTFLPYPAIFLPGSRQSLISEFPPEDAVCLLITNSPVNLLCCCHCHCHTGNPSCPHQGCCCFNRWDFLTLYVTCKVQVTHFHLKVSQSCFLH